MTMARQGRANDAKFRPIKKSVKEISVTCPTIVDKSLSDDSLNSLDNLLDDITSEISVSRYVRNLKSMNNTQKSDELESILSSHRETLNTDYEFISSLLKKNEALLRENADHKLTIKQQAIQIQLLENKLKMLYNNQSEIGTNTLESRKIDILEKCCEKLQKQIFEMEEFLHDHGLMWIGVQPSDDCTTSNTGSKTEIKFDESVFNRLIQQIHSLNKWVEGGCEKKIISQSTSSNIACLRNESPVPIVLYADGLCFNSEPFRLYKSHDTLQFIQDILDGYFPSELQSRYPNGVQLKLIDKHTEHFMSPRKPNPFLSSGHKLGSLYNSLADESNEDYDISSHEKFMSNKEENGITVKQVGNQSDEEMNNLLSELIPHEPLTFDDLLKRLPESKVTKSGHIINVRKDIKDEYGGHGIIPTINNIETDHLIKEHITHDDELITLRVYSENGSEIYTLKMHPMNTVEELYSILNCARSKSVSTVNRSYRLVAMGTRNSHENSNQLCYRQSLVDLSATLKECGIAGRTTLRMEYHPYKLTKRETQIDVNNLLSTQQNNLWNQTESVVSNQRYNESLNKSTTEVMEPIWSRENIRALQNLLTDPEERENGSDHDDAVTPMSKIKPSDIGPKPKSNVKKEKPIQKAKNPDDIWDADEIPEGTQYEDIYDPRPQPKYEIMYRQAVTAEDVYLQLGRKNPTTACCEFMVIKITLPDTQLSSINLDVKETFLDLRAPKYKLGLYLPNPVDPDSSKAEWNEDKEILEVTLRNKREYDFMNE
ncbi:unnamed protein product [Trichobilharzia szidati]|nr:unnamed protein product [Trichobilharzia szidati]